MVVPVKGRYSRLVAAVIERYNPPNINSAMDGEGSLTESERVKLFDEWAEDYDDSIGEWAKQFPFEGYEDVLGEIERLSHAAAGLSVLDLGIGTGRLAERFVKTGCAVWGMDFSPMMLAKVHRKLPQVELIKADLLGHWPLPAGRTFNRIVSAYTFHEFDLDSKVRLLSRLASEHLATGGRLVVGDISFPSEYVRDTAREKWADVWDDEEYYWASDEAREALHHVGLDAYYHQVSICGGVYVIEPR